MQSWFKGKKNGTPPAMPIHIQERLKRQHDLDLSTPKKYKEWCSGSSFLRVIASFSTELEESAAEQSEIGACMSYYMAVVCEALLSEACTEEERCSSIYEDCIQILILAYELTAFANTGRKVPKNFRQELINTEDLKEAQSLLGSVASQSKDNIKTSKMFGLLLFIPRMVEKGLLKGIPQVILDRLLALANTS